MKSSADRTRRMPERTFTCAHGCVYHHKRGAIIFKNDIVIRQDKLDAAFLEALAETIDDRLLARCHQGRRATAVRHRRH